MVWAGAMGKLYIPQIHRERSISFVGDSLASDQLKRNKLADAYSRREPRESIDLLEATEGVSGVSLGQHGWSEAYRSRQAPFGSGSSTALGRVVPRLIWENNHGSVAVPFATLAPPAAAAAASPPSLFHQGPGFCQSYPPPSIQDSRWHTNRILNPSPTLPDRTSSVRSPQITPLSTSLFFPLQPRTLPLLKVDPPPATRMPQVTLSPTPPLCFQSLARKTSPMPMKVTLQPRGPSLSTRNLLSGFLLLSLSC